MHPSSSAAISRTWLEVIAFEVPAVLQCGMLLCSFMLVSSFTFVAFVAVYGTKCQQGQA